MTDLPKQDFHATAGFTDALTQTEQAPFVYEH